MLSSQTLTSAVTKFFAEISDAEDFGPLEAVVPRARMKLGAELL
jgi:hypothetical protein